MAKECPKCGGKRFITTAHIVQDWVVDEDGNFVSMEGDCVEVAHRPCDDNIWTCVKCGYDARGYEFEKN